MAVKRPSVSLRRPRQAPAMPGSRPKRGGPVPCRIVVYAVGGLLTALVFLGSAHQVPDFHDTQWHAALGFGFLYLALLVTPLYELWPGLPGRSRAREMRRALGLSALWFAALHSYFGWFRFVGGFDGLAYWSTYFRWSLVYGLIALAILVLLAVTSLPAAVRRMGSAWKPTQRLAYLAAVLMLMHGATVTIHIRNLRPLLGVAYVFVLLLVALEMVRLDRRVSRPRGFLPERTITVVGLPFAAAVLFWAFFVLDHHTH